MNNNIPMVDSKDFVYETPTNTIKEHFHFH